MEQRPALKDKSEFFVTGACVATAGADLGPTDAGRCVGLGDLRGSAAHAVHAGTPRTMDLRGESVPATAWDAWSPHHET
jgi:hypothetical protein